MKRTAILFLVLLTAFTGVWVFKSKNPINRPNSYANGLEGNYWWNSMAEAEVSPNWKLSEGVPDNYIPVPGMTEVYMVVDEDGYIIGYKKGTKDENGNWTWEDTNPDIPENYEAVPGLENVYKVTYDDGSVKYFKYVRNQDDTFAFVEVDAKGNMIGMEKPSGGEVPENYERVNRNQYAIKNNDGVTIGYRERVPDNSTESGYRWDDIEEPTTGITAEVPKLPEFDLNTDITGTGDTTGGTMPHGSGFFASSAAVPTLMPEQVQTVTTKEETTTSGTFVFSEPQIITTTQEHIIAASGGNSMQAPNYQFSDEVRATRNPAAIGAVQTPDPSLISDSGMNQDQGQTIYAELPNVTRESQGTLKSTEMAYTQKVEGNYLVTYVTPIEYEYSLDGEQLAKHEGTPTEVAREPLASSFTSASVGSIESSLSKELDRMVSMLGNAGARYIESVPNDMVNLINQERTNQGLPGVTFKGSSSAYKIACCRAAMMALTNTSNNNLQSYGNLASMCSIYGIKAGSPSENMLVVSAGTSANSIHSTFQGSNSGSSRMSSAYTEVAIAIVEKDGKYFVDEVFLK